MDLSSLNTLDCHQRHHAPPQTHAGPTKSQTSFPASISTAWNPRPFTLLVCSSASFSDTESPLITATDPPLSSYFFPLCIDNVSTALSYASHTFTPMLLSSPMRRCGVLSHVFCCSGESYVVTSLVSLTARNSCMKHPGWGDTRAKPMGNLCIIFLFSW